MSLLPLPSAFADLLRLSAPGNRSLLFDRAMDRYEGEKIEEGGKEGFLRSFRDEFRNHRDPDEFRSFLARRKTALQSRGARSIRLTAQTRLVVGLGLPHPIETGFLFDRLTGCPYLPGSSVKGLLRAAARLVREGELEGDRGFWSEENHTRIFGPEIGPGSTPATAAIVFYDAFPVSWLALEVDVLTPHQGKYYRGEAGAFPADWDKPVPVPFLAVEAGASFDFFLGPAGGHAPEGDLAQLERLLETALDWLGVGAKKSSGYGCFGKVAPPQASSVQAARGARQETKEKTQRGKRPLPQPDSPKTTTWRNAELLLFQGAPTAYRGSQQATCKRDDLDTEVIEALKKSKRGLRADLEVVKLPGGGFRISQVLSWRPPDR